MLSYKRSARVAELLQQEVSRIMQELKEPGLGFVTVTGVKLSDDLKFARVFYSVIGSKEDVDRSRDIIKASVPSIRHEVAARLNLRRTPELVFEFDETPERASRVFDLLEKIRTEQPGEGGEPGPGKEDSSGKPEETAEKQRKDEKNAD